MALLTFSVSSTASDMTAEHRVEDGVRFVTTERRQPASPAAPNPLETLLAALAGCMNVVARMVAREMNLDLRRLTFVVEGSLDPRGMMGAPDVPPHFRTVSVRVTAEGALTDAQVAALRAEVGRRCPVHRLFEAAGVVLDESWGAA
jgi:putative redox protein